ncbi:hypothetical protein [Kitasatospora sp. NPDC090091]|uniref:hypothetical protein n=1 Tax=Kitasatospora sp. NPDC090091 TaxID=3364081 RepID=UPI00382233CB
MSIILPYTAQHPATTPERSQPFDNFAPTTNLGFVPETSTLPNDIARHQEMARLLADPATVLLNAFADWVTAVSAEESDDVEAVTMVQAMDLRYGGTAAEGLTRRATLLLAQLLRQDTELRTERGIPSAPAWAGVAQ